MQIDKESIFITDHEEQEERLRCKVFQQTQAPFQTEHDLLIEQPLTCFVPIPTRCTDIDKNQTTSSHNVVCDSHLRWWSFAFIHLTLPQTQHQAHGGSNAGDICQRLPPDEAWHKVKSPKAD